MQHPQLRIPTPMLLAPQIHTLILPLLIPTPQVPHHRHPTQTLTQHKAIPTPIPPKNKYEDNHPIYKIAHSASIALNLEHQIDRHRNVRNQEIKPAISLLEIPTGHLSRSLHPSTSPDRLPTQHYEGRRLYPRRRASMIIHPENEWKKIKCQRAVAQQDQPHHDPHKL